MELSLSLERMQGCSRCFSSATLNHTMSIDTLPFLCRLEIMRQVVGIPRAPDDFRFIKELSFADGLQLALACKSMRHVFEVFKMTDCLDYIQLLTCIPREPLSSLYHWRVPIILNTDDVKSAQSQVASMPPMERNFVMDGWHYDTVKAAGICQFFKKQWQCRRKPILFENLSSRDCFILAVLGQTIDDPHFDTKKFCATANDLWSQFGGTVSKLEYEEQRDKHAIRCNQRQQLFLKKGDLASTSHSGFFVAGEVVAALRTWLSNGQYFDTTICDRTLQLPDKLHTMAKKRLKKGAVYQLHLTHEEHVRMHAAVLFCKLANNVLRSPHQRTPLLEKVVADRPGLMNTSLGAVRINRQFQQRIREGLELFGMRIGRDKHVLSKADFLMHGSSMWLSDDFAYDNSYDTFDASTKRTVDEHTNFRYVNTLKAQWESFAVAKMIAKVKPVHVASQRFLVKLNTRYDGHHIGLTGLFAFCDHIKTKSNRRNSKLYIRISDFNYADETRWPEDNCSSDMLIDLSKSMQKQNLELIQKFSAAGGISLQKDSAVSMKFSNMPSCFFNTTPWVVACVARNTIGPTVHDYEYLAMWNSRAHEPLCERRERFLRLMEKSMSGDFCSEKFREICQPMRVTYEKFFDHLGSFDTVADVIQYLAKRSYFTTECRGCTALLHGAMATSSESCYDCVQSSSSATATTVGGAESCSRPRKRKGVGTNSTGANKRRRSV